MLLRTFTLDCRVIHLSCLCVLRKREAFNLVQEIFDRLCTSTKATDNNVLVKTCSARTRLSTTQLVKEVTIMHKIFAGEVWLVHKWGPAVLSLKVEQTATIEQLIFAVTVRP
jgi:hypothetical protein